MHGERYIYVSNSRSHRVENIEDMKQHCATLTEVQNNCLKFLSLFTAHSFKNRARIPQARKHSYTVHTPHTQSMRLAHNQSTRYTPFIGTPGFVLSRFASFVFAIKMPSLIFRFRRFVSCARNSWCQKYRLTNRSL